MSGILVRITKLGEVLDLSTGESQHVAHLELPNGDSLLVEISPLQVQALVASVAGAPQPKEPEEAPAPPKAAPAPTAPKKMVAIDLQGPDVGRWIDEDGVNAL